MNLFDLPPLPLTDELVELLTPNEAVRVERILSTGQTTDWQDSPDTEFVVLLEGQAVIEYKSGRSVSLVKGDTLLIRPHEQHRVSFTSATPPCIWLCVLW